MRKCPLSASRLSPAGTSGDVDAPGGIGPGFAHPLKCDSINSQLPTSKSQRRTVPSRRMSGVGARLCAFVLERFPFALPIVQQLVETGEPRATEQGRASFRTALRKALSQLDASDLPETTPRVSAATRLE